MSTSKGGSGDRDPLSLEYDRMEKITTTIARVWRGDKCGIVSAEKRLLVVPIEYDKIESFTNELFRVWRGDKCGLFYTETDPALVLAIEYSKISFFTEYQFQVLRDGMWGVFDLVSMRIDWSRKPPKC